MPLPMLNQDQQLCQGSIYPPSLMYTAAEPSAEHLLASQEPGNLHGHLRLAEIIPVKLVTLKWKWL